MVEKNAEDLVLIGKITKPHGIGGELKVYPYSGEPENLLHYTRFLLITGEGAEPVEYRVKRARVQKNTVLLKLAGADSRNDAEALVNSRLYVSEDDLPDPDPDEFYLRDLEGKQMITEQGQLIGRISRILFGNGQDIAEVRDESGRQKHTYLIPLAAEFLLAIEEDTVRVSLPPGLLEING
jgi:16S rRNA processing protein RimM